MYFECGKQHVISTGLYEFVYLIKCIPNSFYEKQQKRFLCIKCFTEIFLNGSSRHQRIWHNHPYFVAFTLTIKDLKENVLLNKTEKRGHTNNEGLFSPGICFNTQPWFSTLHWGSADGLNAGKVGLKHFTLLARPAIDIQYLH